ncbi:MAG: prepilin-type N-terminal cleavage/methylation domain-containing protein [Bacilli bacterium]|nr:prepilin-type N-terminal cleavage/methylation domain-containing protein [Bacilli bacterium]MDD4283154.1 prepilin-type N-terminal cleavage/methylation domain-containing protein [Bacilli bacterium]MDD4719203.1 prepilin-type N-terminal cleavage/methylation domain-containing protein [Bacilli bacterium]
MTRKNKGFTLIELLAVIIILVIIFLITVPVIGNVINRARYGAFGSSKKGIERAAELYYASNAKDIVWENDIGYVEIGTLKSKKYLKGNIINTLNNLNISDDTKVLLYKNNNKVEYSLQLYNEIFFDWYQEQMILGSKKNKDNLPVNVGDIITIELDTLMEQGLTDELRLPLSLEDRCVGYVEIEKTSNDDYEYNAYVDCLTEASSFASHYVSYGGKYLDEFNDLQGTSDGGFIAVGRSNSEVITKYGTENNGKYDAIIVKFKSDGEVEWSKNFGGSNDDVFNSVVEGPDGYVAVGQTSSDDGDIIGYNGGNSDAIIVKYDINGNVLYKKSYGSNSSASNHNERFTNIIMDGNSYIIVGNVDGRSKSGDLADVSQTTRQYDGIILKTDLNLNVTLRKFIVGSYNEVINSIIKTTDNHYVVAGRSNSKDYDMEGIGYTDQSYNHEGIIFKYDIDGNLVTKTSFKGSKEENFLDITEVSDGYIVVGNSMSSNEDMEGLSKADNGYSDAIIVKYDKNLENILWKKSFGGIENEIFYGITNVNENEVVAIGYSKSRDMDMQELSKAKEGYSDGIIVKFNTSNGNVIAKKTFGGDNSEKFRKIIKTKDNKLLISGNSYSINRELNNFNKGHQDAIIVKYDINLNLIKELQEPVVIIDKLKEIVVDYGTDLKLRYDNIYTTNDPEKDLKGWCTISEPYIEGNTSNYYYPCLQPFNADDQIMLVEKEVTRGMKLRIDDFEYKIVNPLEKQNSWILIYIATGGNSGDIGYSNLRLNFKDGYSGHITDAIDKGYIEPLVTVNSDVTNVRPAGLLPTVIDIINENGTTGTGSYPSLKIVIKPKKNELVSINLTTNKNSAGLSDGLGIYELRNFDMSITPTK